MKRVTACSRQKWSSVDMRTLATAIADRLLIQLAPDKDGLVTRAQLMEIGLDAHAIRRRCEAGLLVRVLPGVYRVAAVPVSWRQKARATDMWLRGAERCRI